MVPDARVHADKKFQILVCLVIASEEVVRVDQAGHLGVGNCNLESGFRMMGLDASL